MQTQAKIKIELYKIPKQVWQIYVERAAFGLELRQQGLLTQETQKFPNSAVITGLVGNVGDMLADMSSRHSMSPCFGQQPTCRQHRDWESILVTCRHIL